VQALCNFTAPPYEWTTASISCVHGAGHAFLINAAPPTLFGNYSACRQPGWALFTLPEGTLEAALAMCADAPARQHGVVAAEGVFEAFFQIGPSLVGAGIPNASVAAMLSLAVTDATFPWTAVCEHVKFSVPCFMTAYNYVGRGDFGVYRGRLERPKAADCLREGMPEHAARGCIAGVSRWLFMHSPFTSVMHKGTGINKWCLTFVPVGLVSERNHLRWTACIAGSMYGLVFGPSRERGLTGGQLSSLCPGLLHVRHAGRRQPNTSKRREAYAVCTAFACRRMPSDAALSMLPEWMAEL